MPLLDVILAQRTTGEIEIPDGYPHGSSGLSNLLADLESESWMRLYDDGETEIWTLPTAGVEFFHSRESDTYTIRRITAPNDIWHG